MDIGKGMVWQQAMMTWTYRQRDGVNIGKEGWCGPRQGNGVVMGKGIAWS